MNDLVQRTQTTANDQLIKSLSELMSLSEVLVKSGLLPVAVNTKEKAAVLILKGRELGIGAMEALNSIAVISGKPTTSPQLMIALARRTGQLEDLKIEDDGTSCTVTVKRTGQSPITTKFTMEDATSMGLASKDNWKKQPKVMRQWRAVAANLRVTFPDAIAGLYTHEEMGAEVEVNDDGNMTITKMPTEVIEGKATELQPAEKEAVSFVKNIVEIGGSEYREKMPRIFAKTDGKPAETTERAMRILLTNGIKMCAMHPAELSKDNATLALAKSVDFFTEVTGVAGADNLEIHVVGALLDWLKLEKFIVEGKNRYRLSKESPTATVQEVIRQARIKSGQMTLE